MSKLDVKLKKPGVQVFLSQSNVMTRKDFASVGLYTHDINQMLERGLIKRVDCGRYQVVKNDKCEKIIPNTTPSSFEEIQAAFEEGDVATLYQCFQNIEFNEDTIRNLYPLLLSELISLKKEISELKAAQLKNDIIEKSVNFEEAPYAVQMREVFANSHDVNKVYHYLDSLGLEGNDEMRAKLMASQFFAQEKLYDASDKCFKEVERYPKKDAELKEQIRNTQQQIRLIKAKNK